jgi:hypothetical protein
METRERALETCAFCSIGRPAKPFFLYEACGPQRAEGHVEAPEPTPAVRRGLEPWDMRQCQSPPWPRGEALRYRTCGSTRAHPGREARFRVVGHMVMSEPASVGKQCPEL